jgi:nicotinate-nucleotide adenylyltransferase
MTDNRQNSTPPVRVGLFGGTFNPVHRGHIEAADDVRKQFRLDRIHFIPSFVPPHKKLGEMASARHRLAMTSLALEGKQAMQASDIEVRRGGPSYTIETLRGFKSSEAPEHRFFFLIGLDAFLEIHAWKEYLQLFDEAAFIIMSRPRSGLVGEALGKTVESYARTRISKRYRLSADGSVLKHPAKMPLFMARVKPMAISSSSVREAIRRGHKIDQWVVPAVAHYIEEKGLYR